MNTYMKVGERYIARKVSKYGVFSGPYFPPVFGLNTRKYEPEETPYLDKFHGVLITWNYFIC